MKLPFTLSFSSNILPVVSAEKDKYLALASLDTLKQYIPSIDTDKNIDLLPVAFNAFVANRFNKNGDGVDTETTISMANLFVNKPINIEHERRNIIGVILNAAFSEFGSDKPLTAEELKEYKKPFNVTLGGVLWRVVNEDVIAKIEESNDPTSEYYQKISASWEVGFTDYELVLVKGESRNLEDGKHVSDENEIKILEHHLKQMGGTGMVDDDTRIYRLAKGNVLPIGIGLTERPAADVVGVAVNISKDNDEEDDDINDENDNNLTSAITNSSHSEGNDVKQDKVMKIASTKELTDDVLKTVTASEVLDLIKQELDSAVEQKNAEYNKQIEEKNNALNTANQSVADLKKSNEELVQKLANIEKQLSEMVKAEEERNQLAKFSARMGELDAKYKFSSEEREVVAKDIRSLSDEDYTVYATKLDILLKNKIQASETATTQEENKQNTSQTVVENVIDNGKKDGAEVANATSVAPSLKETYKQAFDPDKGFEFEYNGPKRNR